MREARLSEEGGEVRVKFGAESIDSCVASRVTAGSGGGGGGGGGGELGGEDGRKGFPKGGKLCIDVGDQ